MILEESAKLLTESLRLWVVQRVQDVPVEGVIFQILPEHVRYPAGIFAASDHFGQEDGFVKQVDVLDVPEQVVLHVDQLGWDRDLLEDVLDVRGDSPFEGVDVVPLGFNQFIDQVR